MDWSFYNPVKVYLLDLPAFRLRLGDSFCGKRLGLLISNRSVRNYGLEETIAKLSMKNDVILVGDTPSNPTLESIHAALALFGAKKPDALIAIGGGSAIDTAKAIAAAAGEPWPVSLEQLYQVIKTKAYQGAAGGIPVLAVPTTAGSGADLTMWGTVWDARARQKYSVEAPWLFPAESWIVPELTATMPPRLTLSTGLDALCHATEAWWSTRSNAVVRQMAAASISLITGSLPDVLSSPGDLDARSRMCRGALFAALAFSNTRTTACHGLSYPLTLHFGMEHGFAVALTLYQVLRVNWPQIEEKQMFLKAWGVGDSTEIGVWLDRVSAPLQRLRLSAFGIDAGEVRAVLLGGGLAKERMGNNPVELTEEHINRIIDAIA